MPKTVIHTDDLPHWAVRKEKLPYSYLDHLAEAVHPSADGTRMISLEEVMMRQQFDAAIRGKSKAITFLLRKIIDENGAELAACRKRPVVQVEGVHYFQPLAPILALLGCVTIRGVKGSTENPEQIELGPWFEAELHDRCQAEKLKPVKAWLKSGGVQKPRIRERDRHD